MRGGAKRTEAPPTKLTVGPPRPRQDRGRAECLAEGAGRPGRRACAPWSYRRQTGDGARTRGSRLLRARQPARPARPALELAGQGQCLAAKRQQSHPTHPDGKDTRLKFSRIS